MYFCVHWKLTKAVTTKYVTLKPHRFDFFIKMTKNRVFMHNKSNYLKFGRPNEKLNGRHKHRWPTCSFQHVVCVHCHHFHQQTLPNPVWSYAVSQWKAPKAGPGVTHHPSSLCPRCWPSLLENPQTISTHVFECKCHRRNWESGKVQTKKNKRQESSVKFTSEVKITSLIVLSWSADKDKVMTSSVLVYLCISKDGLSRLGEQSGGRCHQLCFFSFRLICLKEIAEDWTGLGNVAHGF